MPFLLQVIHTCTVILESPLCILLYALSWLSLCEFIVLSIQPPSTKCGQKESQTEHDYPFKLGGMNYHEYLQFAQGSQPILPLILSHSFSLSLPLILFLSLSVISLLFISIRISLSTQCIPVLWWTIELCTHYFFTQMLLLNVYRDTNYVSSENCITLFLRSRVLLHINTIMHVCHILVAILRNMYVCLLMSKLIIIARTHKHLYI